MLLAPSPACIPDGPPAASKLRAARGEAWPGTDTVPISRGLVPGVEYDVGMYRTSEDDYVVPKSVGGSGLGR